MTVSSTSASPKHALPGPPPVPVPPGAPSAAEPSRPGLRSSLPKTPLRLALVSAWPPGRGSLSEYGLHLAESLAEQADVAEVHVVADTGDLPPLAVDGVSAEPCWTFNDWTNPIRILRAVRRSKPDAVIFNLQFASFGDGKLPGALGLLTPWLVRRSGIPTTVLLHNLADTVDMQAAGFARSRVTARMMTLAGRLLTKALLRADLVALTIPRYVELLQSAYGATNALLAPHGSFTELVELSEEDTAVPPGRRRIMAFGKWGTYKTVDVLVDAYQLLLDRGYDDLELVLAGTDSPNSVGYMASVAERHRDLPGLVLTGYVGEADVEPLFRSSSVVAFPYTSTTGSSGVLHQAGEYGRAAVLPRIGDLIDIIEEEGFAGVYFAPGDPVSLADALAEVLDDPTRRVELGQRNLAAAAGVPLHEVAHWHVVHLRRLIARAGT